jgi:hypothetical protein
MTNRLSSGIGCFDNLGRRECLVLADSVEKLTAEVAVVVATLSMRASRSSVAGFLVF